MTTWDRWFTAAYLLWLVGTAFYIGVLVGRQQIRTKVTKALEEAQRVTASIMATGRRP